MKLNPPLLALAAGLRSRLGGIDLDVGMVVQQGRVDPRATKRATFCGRYRCPQPDFAGWYLTILDQEMLRNQPFTGLIWAFPEPVVVPEEASHSDHILVYF